MKLPVRLGRPAVSSAARTAIAGTLSFLIARLAGMAEAYWAPIITLVIMQSTLGATVKISVERTIGTVLGTFAGGVLGSYFPREWWVFCVGVFLMGVVCALLRLENSFRFAGVTLAIVILIPRAISPWVVAWHRFLEVSIGIVVGLAMTAIWPDPMQEAS